LNITHLRDVVMNSDNGPVISNGWSQSPEVYFVFSTAPNNAALNGPL